MKIEGCVALVTGANRGLGKAYAEALLAGPRRQGLRRRPRSVVDRRSEAHADQARRDIGERRCGGGRARRRREPAHQQCRHRWPDAA